MTEFSESTTGKDLHSTGEKTTMKRDTLVLRPASVLRVLSLITLLLIAAGLAVQVLQHLMGYESAYNFIPLFNLGLEKNIPTFFSTVILLISAVLLAFIALLKSQEQDRFALRWAILSFIFLFLSVDEAAQIHEATGYILQRFTGKGEGIFSFLWVIPYGLLMIVFVAYYIPFLIHLPRKTKILMLLSGVIYVGGALGTEFIEGWYGKVDFVHGLIVTLQESLEIIGIVVFIYTLLRYMRGSASEMSIRVE